MAYAFWKKYCCEKWNGWLFSSTFIESCLMFIVYCLRSFMWRVLCLVFVYLNKRFSIFHSMFQSFRYFFYSILQFIKPICKQPHNHVHNSLENDQKRFAKHLKCATKGNNVQCLLLCIIVQEAIFLSFKCNVIFWITNLCVCAMYIYLGKTYSGNKNWLSTW